jgi:hypothetical protein
MENSDHIDRAISKVKRAIEMARKYEKTHTAAFDGFLVSEMTSFPVTQDREGGTSYVNPYLHDHCSAGCSAGAQDQFEVMWYTHDELIIVDKRTGRRLAIRPRKQE